MFSREELVAVLSIQKMPIMPPPPHHQKKQNIKKKNILFNDSVNKT